MKEYIRGSLKAILAGIAAGIAFAGPVVDDGVKPSEALGIAGATIAAFVAVYFVKNTGSKAPQNNEPVPEADHLPGL